MAEIQIRDVCTWAHRQQPGWRLLVDPIQGPVCVSLTQINCDLSWSREAMEAICLCNYLSEGSLLLLGKTQHIII